MSLSYSTNRKLRYLGLTALFASLLVTSCSPRGFLKNPKIIENYNLYFSQLGIKPVDYANLSEQDWWESFYCRLINIEASHLKHYIHLERNTELDSLIKYTETRGDQFYSDEVGVVVYLTLGDNSGPIANVSYFRILNKKSFSGDRSLELLIEKGVEVSWEYLTKRITKRHTYDVVLKKEGIPWILYRFKISKVASDEQGLFNTALRLSCDKYYCVTGIDGTRRMLLAENRRRYDDLIIPESAGHKIVARLFDKAIRTFNQYYNMEK
jgi:hypothetical protein